MTDPELEPTPGDPELAHQLEHERPVPAAGFRGALGRHLDRHDPGYGPRPARLRWIVAGYTGSGLAMLALGLLVATGTL